MMFLIFGSLVINPSLSFQKCTQCAGGWIDFTGKKIYIQIVGADLFQSEVG